MSMLRRSASRLSFALLLFGSCAAQSQSPPDASSNSSFCPSLSQGDNRQVSWKTIAPNILCDQRRIWLFPWHLARGENIVPTAGIASATTGLILLDPSEAPYFRRTNSFHRFNQIFSGNNTALATELVPLSFYAAGLVRRDKYTQQTALLAGEAVLDSEILTTVMKDVDRRLRPIDIAPHGNFSKTWFNSKGAWWRGDGSFPSGHAIAAFSVATIFARRYRTHKWAPYAAYGAAALIGFSRLAVSAHFPSDVFLGAALGYSISRFVVLH